MFQIDSDMTIYITRGDVAYFTVAAEHEGERHIFRPGDVVRFKVTAKKDCTNVMFQKDFAITEESEKVDILLTEAETKMGEVISKPVDYWYEIELNPYTNPQTIVGYDEDGAKIFKLFPEGRDLTSDISEEDVPVVDEALDFASERPVQNQAIARAVIELSERIDKEKTENSRKCDDLKETDKLLAKNLAFQESRLDTLLLAKGEDLDGYAELIDIRTDYNGKGFSTAGDAVRNATKRVQSVECLNSVIPLPWDLVAGVRTANVDFWGYFDLMWAIADINADTIGENQSNGNNDGEVEAIVYKNKENIPVVVLIKDVTLVASVGFTKETIFDLGGFTLTLGLGAKLTINTGANVTIDGRMPGSAIQKNFETSSVEEVVIDTYGVLNINKGIYKINAKQSAGRVVGIYVQSSGNLCCENIEVHCGLEETSPQVGGIVSIGGASEINNSKIVIRAKAAQSMGVSNNKGGIMTINNSSVIVDTCTGAGGSATGGTGIQITKNSTTHINNSYAFGTMTGISNKGNLYINGGEYTGVGHGGLYNSIAGTIAYVENAIIKSVAYDGVFKNVFTYNVQYQDAAMYFRADATGSLNAYFDNCEIINEMNGKNIIAIAGTGLTAENSLYMSNCSLGGNGKIRVDDPMYRLYLGFGNNITADDVNWSTIGEENRDVVVINTDNIYVKTE